VVLIATTMGIARLVVSGDTELFPVFGFPPVLPPARGLAVSRSHGRCPGQPRQPAC
jgi:hypothetical protein